ncbi:MAG: hypothetical protein QW638_01645 [Candidatus Bathyarchaeia archaeon]|nr:hypothetical protein [Candidatus Bathyarchaeota archaeon]
MRHYTRTDTAIAVFIDMARRLPHNLMVLENPIQSFDEAYKEASLS